ncbi:phytoene desaturase [soil metagenome]
MGFPVKKSLKGRRAAVIGSGPAGLSAAISLAVRGARVVVIERGPVLCPQLRAVRWGAYRFDPWPPLFSSPGVYAELFASAGHRLTDFVNFERADPVCRVHFGDGNHFDYTGDLADLFRQAEAISASDAKGFRRLIRRGRALSSAHQGHHRTGYQDRKWLALDFKLWKAFPAIIDPRSDLYHARRGVRNKQLRNAVLALRSLSQLSPARSKGGYFRWLADFQENDGWFAPGGGEVLARAMLRLCELLGVKVQRNAAVEQIELQGGRVKRLTGTGMKPIAVSIVVGAEDAPDTLRLLPQGHEEIAKLRDRWRKHVAVPARSVSILGAKKQWPELAHLNVFASEDAVEESRFIDRWRVPCPAPSIVVSNAVTNDATAAPAGHSALVARIEEPNTSARFLWSTKHADERHERTVELLEKRGLKDLRGNLDIREHASPLTASRRELETFARIDGYQTKSFRAALAMPPNRVMETPGLYLASAFTHPGPGSTNEITAGMLAAVQAADDAI